MTRKKQEKKTVKIEISSELADELESIRESMDKWMTLPATMDTVIKTIIQYYYISIGFPFSRWNKSIKSDERDIKEMLDIAKISINRMKNKYDDGNGKKRSN